MRRFSGAGGSLYALGERFCFSAIPLGNCGDGWDWRSPLRFSYWIEEPIIITVANGAYETPDPVTLFLETGRVGLPRNMSHGEVFATGECLPISLVSGGDEWELHIDATVGDTSHIGGESASNQTRILGVNCVVRNTGLVPIDKVLARLPSGDGMFVGIGEVRNDGADTVINFDQEGVRYVLG